MASLQSSITNFSPNIISTATVTEKSRSGTSVVLNISISTHLRYSSSYLGSGYTISGVVTANGSTKTLTLKSSSATWSGTTAHSTSSTMTITVPASTTSITVKYQAKVSGNGESGSGNTPSASLTLSKVLASVTAVTSFTDTTNPKVTFSNPGNFKLYPYINLWTQQTNGTQIGTTIRPNGMSSTGANISSPYTWDLTEAQRNTIRNWFGTRSSGWATIGVNTFDGSTNLGSSSKGASFTNNLSPPTFSDFTYEDINPNTLAITGDSSKIILGYSTLRITISGNNKATANKGATMSHYLINNTQYSYDDNFSIDIPNWNASSITIVAVDSRGLSTSVTKSFTIGPYSALSKSSGVLTRDGNINEETKLNYSGTATYELPNGNTNTLIASYQYKKTGDATYTTGTTTITPTFNNDGSFNFEDYIIGDIATGFEISETYNVIVTVSDALSIINYNLVLNSGIPAISIKGNNVALHGVYDEQLGGTQLNGDLYLNGQNFFTALGLDTNTYNPSSTYSSGAMVIYKNVIYECNTNNTTGTWDPSKWDVVPIIVP